MLDPRRLALLRAVSAHGSISEAAHAMAYTPSAASQQLQLLERTLGVRLVDRGSRGATLTPAGQTLLEHAHGILGRIETAEAEMHALATLRAGRLRLAVFPTAGAAFMPAAIATFSRRHPEVHLTLTEAEADELVVSLQRHQVDLIVGYDFDRAPNPPALGNRVPLLDDPLRLALPSGHHLAEQSEISLADLDQEAWIDSDPGRPCSQALHAACAIAGFVPRVVYRSDDYANVHRLIAARVGIAVVPTIAADPGRTDVVYRDVTPALPIRRIYIGTAEADTPAATAMTAILRTVAADPAGGRDRASHNGG